MTPTPSTTGSTPGKVSVIIPCYNYARYLPDAIESVLNQTHSVEVIVVNDGSTDNTAEIASHYPVILITQDNRGLPAARNTGVSAATGQRILCLDADDKLAPTCIARLLEYDGIVCPGQQEFEGGTHFYTPHTSLTLDAFLKENRIHCASMFPKVAWEQVGGYDETFFRGLEDWDFWIRLLKAGYSVTTINEPLFFYRIHVDSMTRRPDGIFHNYQTLLTQLKTKHDIS